jgi:hypothetical protein
MKGFIKRILVFLIIIFNLSNHKLRSQNYDNIPIGSIYFELDSLAYISGWGRYNPSMSIMVGSRQFELQILFYDFCSDIQEKKYAVRNNSIDSFVYVNHKLEAICKPRVYFGWITNNLRPTSYFSSMDCELAMGNVNITKIDTIARHISGTFEVILCNEKKEIIKLKNGIINQIPFDKPRRKISRKESEKIQRKEKRKKGMLGIFKR